MKQKAKYWLKLSQSGTSWNIYNIERAGQKQKSRWWFFLEGYSLMKLRKVQRMNGIPLQLLLHSMRPIGFTGVKLRVWSKLSQHQRVPSATHNKINWLMKMRLRYLFYLRLFEKVHYSILSLLKIIYVLIFISLMSIIGGWIYLGSTSRVQPRPNRWGDS